MIDSTKTGDVTDVVVRYYNVTVTALILLAGASLSHWLFGWSGQIWLPTLVCFGVFLAAGLGIFCYMQKQSHSASNKSTDTVVTPSK